MRPLAVVVAAIAGIVLLLPAASVADLSVTASPDRAPDTNGWYTHPVTVTFTAPDPLFTCTDPIIYSGPDSASASVSGSCTDGTTTVPASFSFQYVATPPAATVSLGRAPDHNGWYNHPVAFSVTGSGVATPITCTPGGTYSGPADASVTVGGSCTDAAGLASAPASVSFQYDDSAPDLTVTPDRAPNVNGWYKDPVTITVAGTDAGPSGIASCTPNTVYSAPSGANLEFTGSCTDNAGNPSGPKTLTFNYAGSLSVAVSPERAPDLNGWYNHPVTFTAHGTSAAPVTCDAPVAYSGPATSGTTVALGCTDAAGNNVTGTSASFKYDNTNPAVTVTASRAPDSNGWYNHAVTFTTAGTDGTSGIASSTCTPATTYSGPDGASLSASGTCTDNAGNSAGGSLAFKYASTPPTVVVPADLKLEATGPNGAPAVFTASATDPLDGQPLPPSAVVCDPASGSIFPLGKTTVTCSATGGHGTTGDADFTITVVDTTAPRLNVPGVTTVSSGNADSVASAGADAAAYLASANATDLVDGKVVVTNNAPPSLGVGSTTVTFTAVDKAGNKVSKTSTIVVTKAPAPPVVLDTTPPADVRSLVAKSAPGALTLTWALPSDGDFDHVVVEQSGLGNVKTVVYQGSATSYSVTKLTNGTRYAFVVTAYDHAGNASVGVSVAGVPARAMLVRPADGAAVRAPSVVLVWLAVRGAAYYNVQLYKVAVGVASAGTPARAKVLSVWPTKPTFKPQATWKYLGKSYRLTPGTYVWYVWPGLGPRKPPRYGPLMGQSTFVVK